MTVTFCTKWGTFGAFVQKIHIHLTSCTKLPDWSPSPRLTTVEEELLDLARTLGSQQTSVDQLELELDAEREGVRKGQR